jgi:hypothetical protein
MRSGESGWPDSPGERRERERILRMPPDDPMTLPREPREAAQNATAFDVRPDEVVPCLGNDGQLVFRTVAELEQENKALLACADAMRRFGGNQGAA